VTTRPDSTSLYETIRSLVLSARQNAARGVDLLQVHTNYDIARRIVDQEQQGANRAQYGKEIVRELAPRLTREFGDGFSKTNLEYMRRFYLAYPGRTPQIAQTASGQFPVFAIAQTLPEQLQGGGLPQSPFSLSWSHYVFLIGLKEDERNSYEIEAAQQGWTVRELRRQFDAGLYERLALSRDPQAIRDLARKGQHVAKPEDLLKDPYVLEFLGLEEKPRYSESDLESAIVTHIEHFLLELGKGFLFRGAAEAAHFR
jgi:predicted nuclease of restriction endonuclease-like (RecB) superfamily